MYGSLKSGRYNHPFMRYERYVGDTSVRGTLYIVSSYPALTEDGCNEYHAEIYEMTEEQYEPIRRMEIGAGYKEVEVDGCIVFYADTALAEYCKSNKDEILEY